MTWQSGRKMLGWRILAQVGHSAQDMWHGAGVPLTTLLLPPWYLLLTSLGFIHKVGKADKILRAQTFNH